MKISVLSGNKANNINGFSTLSDIGLCLHIQTKTRKLLYNTGESDIFVKNANKLGLKISDIDYLILSHGYTNFAGGLKYFLEQNTKAKIIMHIHAKKMFYAKRFNLFPIYKGIDQELINANKHRIQFLEESTYIDFGINIICDFNKNNITSNKNSLFIKDGNKFIVDNYKHEIILNLKEQNNNVLFSANSYSDIIYVKNLNCHYNFEDKVDYLFGNFNYYSSYSNINKKSRVKQFFSRKISTNLFKKNNNSVNSAHKIKELKSTQQFVI